MPTCRVPQMGFANRIVVVHSERLAAHGESQKQNEGKLSSSLFS